MTTTRIEIKPHLVEYLRGKYNGGSDGPIRFPDQLDLYVLIWDLTSTRPLFYRESVGNLEIVLPERSLGKSPKTYNWLSRESQQIIERRISMMLRAELHEYMDFHRHKKGEQYNLMVENFMQHYGIESITDYALLKDYQRWRDKVRRNNQLKEI